VALKFYLIISFFTGRLKKKKVDSDSEGGSDTPSEDDDYEDDTPPPKKKAFEHKRPPQSSMSASSCSCVVLISESFPYSPLTDMSETNVQWDTYRTARNPATSSKKYAETDDLDLVCP